LTVVNVVSEDDTIGADGSGYTGNGYSPDPPLEAPDWASIFGAPDYTTLITPKRTVVSREYEVKVKSLLKAGVIGSLNNQNFTDAAALLHYGPAFAVATGQLAEADERARQAIDVITSPTNPYAIFLLTAMPLISQLLRNHEPELREVPGRFRNRKMRRKQARKNPPPDQGKPRFTIHLPFGKTIPIRVSANFKIGKLLLGFKAQTEEPNQLAYKVFSDPKVVTALEKQGIHFQARSANG
jgi:hypothetical protein